MVVCDDCCIVHRNLGREISQIKSVRKSHWSQSQLKTVIELYNCGSNSIWEYTLTNHGNSSITSSLTHSIRPLSRKKPTAKDPLYPNKNDFITAKYAKLAFTKKKAKEEKESLTDLCDELHSSVRSSSLKTSLRLLAAGADPNYMHPEKKTTPLHVAAKSCQLLQMELLFAYGADPLKPDSNGKTALDIAKSASYSDIVDRLVEYQFEVTDRITHFLCGRRPDHKAGQHYLIPEMVDCVVTNEEVKLLRSSLRSLNNKEFEELVKDVYDEVDRRELDEIWLQLCSASSSNPLRDRNLVPYLPVNAAFSSTRNQGRQKLARYCARDFTFLLIDILLETKRRQFCAPHPVFSQRFKQTTKSQTSPLNRLHIDSDNDSDPLYDSVASEEDKDYDEVEPNHTRLASHRRIHHKQRNGNEHLSSDSRKSIEQRLTQSDSLLRELIASNEGMKKDINELKNTVNDLVTENMQLRAIVLSRNPSSESLPIQSNQPPIAAPRSFNRFSAARPQSLPDRSSNPNLDLSPPMVNTFGVFRPPPTSAIHLNNLNSGIMTSPSPKPPPPPPPSRPGSSGSSTHNSHSFMDLGLLSPMRSPCPPVFPLKEEVFRRTEQITRAIQELLKVSLEGRQEVYLKCAESIQQAVGSMVSLFPDKSHFAKLNSTEEQIYHLIDFLKNNCIRLMTECSKVSQTSDESQKVEKIIDCAYEIARFAKQLIMLTTEL